MKSQLFSLPFPAAALIIVLLLSSGCIGDYVANRDIVVVRISPGGETDWAETLDYGFDDYAGDIAITEDGGCIVAGKNASSRYGDYISRLVRFSPGGDILWDKILPGSDGSQYYSRYSVVQTGDSGFAVRPVTVQYSGQGLKASCYGGPLPESTMQDPSSLPPTGDLQRQGCSRTGFRSVRSLFTGRAATSRIVIPFPGKWSPPKAVTRPSSGPGTTQGR
jgi:hypothetical protein